MAGPADSPLTVGTTGHIDHGKTALVRALTGVDTDRLPEEKQRGITITLGFAPLRLPSGRRLSLVDVPGHERLVRVMVSGASGIDLFLLVVAADDGVMPQTLEHIRVLKALDVRDGVVAITKADLADPSVALGDVAELLPGIEAVVCSARTGAGVTALADALERSAARVRSRAEEVGMPVLHVDRVFTIRGAGTVVTGTLWRGAIRRGDRLMLLPSGTPTRVRGVQVHDASILEARAGQRVAVNLTGVERQAIRPGDVLSAEGSPVQPSYRVDARLMLDEPLQHGERIQVHHGTRAVPARAMRLGEEDLWQLRAERPLLVADGDRFVLRRISPPGTFGGGVIVRAVVRHGSSETGGEPAPEPAAVTPPGPQTPLDREALELEQHLRAAAHEPPEEAELGDAARHLPALRRAGRAVRIGRSMYAHPDALQAVAATVAEVIEAEGSITLARLRDELGTSRKYAQALLEHLDASRVTRRLPDDRRILRGQRVPASPGTPDQSAR